MKRKTKEILIRRVVEDRSMGIYIETDMLQKTITIGRGIKREKFDQWEAERLNFLLKRQLDRLKGDYPKEADTDKNELTVCPNCGKGELWEANFCGNCGCKLSSATQKVEEERAVVNGEG